MVKVLPEPVTPSSTWVRSARVDALDQILDRRRLVAGRLEVGHHLDGDAAFGFFRPRRAVRRPQLAVLVQRIAALDQRRQRRHRRGDAGRRHALGVLQRDVEPGDRIQAGGGALAAPLPRRPSRCRAPSWSAPTERSGIFFDLGLDAVGASVNPVIRALRANDIDVTAVHSHMLDEQPRLFFLHFWANDDALKLARGLRAALDNTASTKN